MLRDDTFTTTEADAGRYEAMRGDCGLYGDDRPARGDLTDETMHARIQADRDARARARGDYVPSFWTRLTCSAIQARLVQAKTRGEVSIKRDGVFAITGADYAAVLAALDGFDCDTAEVDGIVWVRSEDSRHDTPPF